MKTEEILQNPQAQGISPTYLAEAEQAINKTVEQTLANGKWLEKRYRSNQLSRLRRLAKHTDIFDGNKVHAYIQAIKLKNKTDATDNFKLGLENTYAHFAEVNNIAFKVVNLQKKSPIPIIPSTDDVNLILYSLPLKWYVPLAIMAKTGAEARELQLTKQNQINQQTGQISIIGTKKHDNGLYTLEPDLAKALRNYLATHTEEYPFPDPRNLGDAWRRARNQKAEELNKPDLKKVPMKNLRNYAGAVFYLTMGKDPIATKNFMRHKRLEQTMDYLRGIPEFMATSKKIGKIVSTAEEVLDLILQGFKEEAIIQQGTPQEKHILSKVNV
ncbi:MAG: hypothetical protein ABSF44_10845 [Candidatus Bathyarchaeia archaeon]|jgi:integrase